MPLAKPPAGGDAPVQVFSAITTETRRPQQLNVVGNEASLGVEPSIELHLFSGPVGPNIFIFNLVSIMTPKVAIEIGEYLAKEGRRVSSGLMLGSAADLTKLHETG